MPVKKEYRNYVHICVCVPNTGVWRSETACSMALMFSYFSLRGVKGVAKAKITILTAQGSMLSQSREILTAKVLKSDATHLLFIDSDMQFPMTTAHDLLERQRSFIGANCTTRTMPPKFVAHDLDGKLLDSRGRTGIQQVQHVGLAVALIETKVIKQMYPPLYLMDWVPDMGVYCGEDVYFTQKLGEVGVAPYIDHDLSRKIKHIGNYAYSPEDIKGKEPAEVSVVV